MSRHFGTSLLVREKDGAIANGASVWVSGMDDWVEMGVAFDGYVGYEVREDEKRWAQDKAG